MKVGVSGIIDITYEWTCPKCGRLCSNGRTMNADEYDPKRFKLALKCYNCNQVVLKDDESNMWLTEDEWIEKFRKQSGGKSYESKSK
jgi:hypothetical protein